MPEHPLLVFPNSTHAERTKRQGFGARLRLPDARHQAQRLAPQFQQLQQAMERRRVSLQDNPLGIQPEQVLVLETIGSIENFANAIRRVEGLEWLGEFERGDIIPDFGFEDESNPERPLRGQLFLVMTNQQALREMHSLFTRWRREPETKFPYGLAKLRDAFRYLQDIRPWSADDRIRQTGLFEDWQFRLENGESTAPFEAELWYRGSIDRRGQAESYVRRIVESFGGQVIQQYIVPDINYHAVLGTMPLARVQEMVYQPGVRDHIALLQCDDIMHIRPVGQCAVLLPENMDEVDTQGEGMSPDSPLGDPIVALFDGLPLTRHQLLDGRIDLDDPDDYESAYLASERFHGTMMASLICHGDLAERGSPAGRRVYARPIMKPRRGFGGQFHESIPQDVLPVDLIHRAVRRLYEPEGGQPPVAPQVRVINLSVCDEARPFNRGISAMARLLDWLAWKYNVLFIVSAGNHPNAIQLDIGRATLPTLTPDQLQRSVIKAVAEDTRNRRLLSPAETFNGLTVAATHQDASVITPNFLLDPFTYDGLPSVVNAQGPGYRRTVKPDVLLPGGRQFLFGKPGNTHSKATLEVARHTNPPGQRVATPGTQGRLDNICHTRGTSNAAALASRSTMLLYDVIGQLRQQSPGTLPTEYDAVLLKTLLVHGADWANAWSLYQQALKNGDNSKTFKEYVGRFLGYGSANITRVLACTDQRITILGVGALGDGDADEFTLPLPPSLSAVTDRRRLTTTLAWLTPVSSTRQNYRIAHLWFNPTQQNTIAPNRMYADHWAVQRGTVQHEVLEGTSATPFQDGDAIVIKVNCRADAGEIIQPIRYGLAVTLEVAEELGIPIYEEVRNRLVVPITV